MLASNASIEKTIRNKYICNIVAKYFARGAQRDSIPLSEMRKGLRYWHKSISKEITTLNKQMEFAEVLSSYAQKKHEEQKIKNKSALF